MQHWPGARLNDVLDGAGYEQEHGQEDEAGEDAHAYAVNHDLRPFFGWIGDFLYHVSYLIENESAS